MAKPVETTEHYIRRGNKRSAEAFGICVDRLCYALRYLDDRSKLNGSPLARLAYVERLAKEKHNGQLLPRGLALRQLILSCVDHIVREVRGESGLSRACQYLQLRVKGFSCKQISNEMGLSREHISRVYRKKALGLLTERFLYMIDGDR